MTQVTVDIPLNRVEGDLDIRVTFEKNKIVDAQCIGTLYRGFENMLTGRVPMDSLVITPRICGICSITHLTAAVKAIESAAQITPPAQAVRMRNLSILAETVQSDLRQVFLMFLGDFAHDYYKDFDFHTKAVEQYEPLKGQGSIAALRASKDIVKVIAIIGGQWPHTSHMVPGGICTLPSLIDMTLVAKHIENTLSWYEKAVLGCSIETFNETITTADALFALVEKLPDTHLAHFVRLCRDTGLFDIGQSYSNFISYGIVDDPEQPNNSLIRSGVILNGTDFHELDVDKIGEDLSHSWYRHTDVVQPPFNGTTIPDRSSKNGYTWSKAPRYGDVPMQTGPIAQALVDGEPLIKDLFKQQGDSTFVRELARLVRPARHLGHLRAQVEQALNNFGQPTFIAPPELTSGRGIGLTEAARGGLGHWRP
ncbi:MAG: nickel-dependent hydrogenase large subunit [Gammaproteobacteria bacterium]|nr:nickel-dependent hydrogenase large subunit [Gammaproteobacteria bacterium]